MTAATRQTGDVAAGVSRRSASKTPPRVITDRGPIDEIIVNGRHVRRDTTITVDGIRGRCLVVGLTRHQSGREWLDITTSRGFARVVAPDKIRTVHLRKASAR